MWLRISIQIYLLAIHKLIGLSIMKSYRNRTFTHFFDNNIFIVKYYFQISSWLNSTKIFFAMPKRVTAVPQLLAICQLGSKPKVTRRSFTMGPWGFGIWNMRYLNFTIIESNFIFILILAFPDCSSLVWWIFNFDILPCNRGCCKDEEEDVEIWCLWESNC